MNERTFDSPIEALYDLQQFVKARDGRVHRAITDALYLHKKRERQILDTGTSQIPEVGIKRIKTLLDAHAAGRYEIIEMIRLAGDF